MKLLIVMLFVALAVADEALLSDEQKAKAHEYAATCLKQVGITKEQAQSLREGNFANADDKAKCFANCFLEQGGFIVNGEVQKDVVLAKLTPIAGSAEKVQAIQAKCDGLKGTDKCDTAFKVFQCYHQNKAL